MEEFVRVANGEFVVGDSSRPFRFIGGNSYHLMVSSFLSQVRCLLFFQSYATDVNKRPLVTQLLDFYAENGLTVLRTWAFSDGDRHDALQIAPGLSCALIQVTHLTAGVLSEWTAASLDFVLHEAAVRGIKLLLVLTNYWGDYGGMQQYVRQFFKSLGSSSLNCL